VEPCSRIAKHGTAVTESDNVDLVITRLRIEDSVESRMVLLQEKKVNMINGTLNNDQVALDKLTPEDMQFLLRGS
jgi:DNA repair protein RAD16